MYGNFLSFTACDGSEFKRGCCSSYAIFTKEVADKIEKIEVTVLDINLLFFGMLHCT